MSPASHQCFVHCLWLQCQIHIDISVTARVTARSARVLRLIARFLNRTFPLLITLNGVIIPSKQEDSVIDLREERRKRLDYLRRVLCLSDRSTEGSSDTEALTCLQCGSAPIEAVLIHGKSGHLCVCRPCALHFRRLVLNCPQCGETVEDVIIPRLHR